MKRFLNLISKPEMTLADYQKALAKVAELYYAKNYDDVVLLTVTKSQSDTLFEVPLVYEEAFNLAQEQLQSALKQTVASDFGVTLMEDLQKYRLAKKIVAQKRVFSLMFWNARGIVKDFEGKTLWLNFLQWRYIFQDKLGTAEDFKSLALPIVMAKLKELYDRYRKLL